MHYSTGELSFIFLIAAALSFIGAWVLARRYRVAMRLLMSAPMATVEAVPPAASADFVILPPPAAITAADNRRAGRRLALVLVALSCLMAFSSAALQLGLAMGDLAFSLKRTAVVAVVNLWAVIPALGLLWRWSRLRVVGTLALWLVLCFLVMQWRSIDPQAPGQYLKLMA